jgi:hypothetical protein
MAHVCKRCGYTATTKASLIRHLQSKSPCLTKDNNTAREVLIAELQKREHKTDTTYCPTCNKLLAKTNLARHKKVCKENTQIYMVQESAEAIQNLQSQIDKLRDELQEHKGQATLTKVSLHLQAQINELRSEFQIHNQLGTTQNKELMNHDDNRIHVQQPQNENIPIQIKTRKSKISQAIRIVCWNTYVGEDIGKTHCLCCKTNSITQHNFHCGHVTAEANGGKLQVENLRPICAVCNNSMGTTSMAQFALEHFNIAI